jgi:hypothetical protein
MELSFNVDGRPARFRRNPETGRADLVVGEDVITLQSPFRLSTHFEVRARKVWRRRIGEHDVEVVRVRQRMFGGLKPSVYSISVDGTLVAESSGER